MNQISANLLKTRILLLS